MVSYLAQRLLLAALTVLAVSMLSFGIIHVTPGHYVTSYVAQMSAMGNAISVEEAHNLRVQYGLDQPLYVQFVHWMGLIFQGNFGMSMEWRKPVMDLIGDRLELTVIVSVAAILVTWVVGLPIGIYSAVRPYSIGDYLATFFGFVGLAVPSFLLSLVLMYIGFKYFNMNVGSLFSDQYVEAP
jgi:peptide/nickel transport system permease protein